MMKLSRNSRLIKLLAGLAIIYCTNGMAACYEKNIPVSREYKQSSAVVVGRVIRETPTPESGNWYEGTTYTVLTTTSFRGHLPKIFSIFSENSSGRFPMAVGSSYLLFVNPQGHRLTVDGCGNSGPSSGMSRELATLEHLKQHAPN